MPDPVLAAGAVLWRPAAGGIEVCVVHRPAYDDWSLPKGKLDGDEHPLVAALREVLEETGLTAVPSLRLPDVRYPLPGGVPKIVEYWSMQVGTAAAVPIADPGEVDEIAWLSPTAATSRLTYPADADLVAQVTALPTITAQTLLVRHGRAGERKKWLGNDALRPLDEVGRRQAEGLRVMLSPFAPKRLFAATPLRCRQTLEPLSEALNLPIVSDSAFAEPPSPDDAAAKAKVAAARLIELRAEDGAAICSQGKLIPPLLGELRQDDPALFKTPKGEGWVLSWSGDRLVALSRL
jgi:8-oxo-dGTP diphosphatase